MHHGQGHHNSRSYGNRVVIIYAVVTQSLEVLIFLRYGLGGVKQEIVCCVILHLEPFKTWVRRCPVRKECTSKVRNAGVFSPDNIYPSFGQSIGNSTRCGCNRKKIIVGVKDTFFSKSIV